MARVTVEDCEKFVQNRFELVILAALRTRQLINGDKPQITPREGEKKAVTSLREIGINSVPLEDLREGVINKFRTVTFEDEDDEDFEELMQEDTYCPSTVVSDEVRAASSQPVLIGTEDKDEVTIVDENGAEIDPSSSI